MTQSLWTHRAAPLEYVELMLCRDVYHCTPSELAEQDYDVVVTHLAMLDAEARVREAERK